MKVSEAIERVLELAIREHDRATPARNIREQYDDLRSIEIVRDIVLTHYKPDALDDDHTGG